MEVTFLYNPRHLDAEASGKAAALVIESLAEGYGEFRKKDLAINLNVGTLPEKEKLTLVRITLAQVPASKRQTVKQVSGYVGAELEQILADRPKRLEIEVRVHRGKMKGIWKRSLRDKKVARLARNKK